MAAAARNQAQPLVGHHRFVVMSDRGAKHARLSVRVRPDTRVVLLAADAVVARDAIGIGLVEHGGVVGPARAAFQDALSDFAPTAIHFLDGAPGRLIPQFVEENRVDLLVMGTVGRTGVPGFFIGNTAEQVLEQVECSVLAVKPDGFVSPVLVADDT